MGLLCHNKKEKKKKRKNERNDTQPRGNEESERDVKVTCSTTLCLRSRDSGLR